MSSQGEGGKVGEGEREREREERKAGVCSYEGTNPIMRVPWAAPS